MSSRGESSLRQLRVSRAFLEKQLNLIDHSVFLEAQKGEKAMISFERALLWREALELAGDIGAKKETIAEMAHRLAGMSSAGRMKASSLMFLFERRALVKKAL